LQVLIGPKPPKEETMEPTPATQMTKATRRQWIALAVLALPCILVVMDLTVLFLAIPKMTADLHPSGTQLLWITDVYGFMVAGLLIAMGALGDRIGRRRVLLSGSAAFGVASLVSAFSVTPEMLIAARALQGIAGATLVPSAMSLVFALFPDEVERTKALGIVMSSFAAGAALGPVVGGALLASFWWGSVFLLNVPVMGLLLIFGPRLLPEVRNPGAGRIDAASVALSIVAMLTAVYGIKQAARGGVGLPSLAAIGAGLTFAALFVRRQLHLADPMIDVRLFRSVVFSTALSANVVVAFVQYGIFLFTSQYLQLALGLTPLQAGIAGLPGIAAVMLSSTMVPKLVAHVRPGYAIAGGTAVTALGFALLTQLPADGGLLLAIAATVVLMIGVAPGTVLGTQLIVGAAPPERAGVASGIAETGNELGGALGIALLGSLGAAIYRHDIAGALDDHLSAHASGAAHDTFAGAVHAAQALPAGVLADANVAFVNALHVVAATNGLLAAALAAATAVLLRRVPGPAAATARTTSDPAVRTGELAAEAA
jgi:DHA2 family multidrug resistance protein-like MFS transporter